MEKLTTLTRVSMHAITWTDLMIAWGRIEDTVRRHLMLLIAQIFSYHIWRERNARAHEKGCFGPLKLLDGIIADVKTKKLCF